MDNYKIEITGSGLPHRIIEALDIVSKEVKELGETEDGGWDEYPGELIIQGECYLEWKITHNE